MERVLHAAPDVPTLLSLLPKGATVADVGCFGWRWSNQCTQLGLNYWGLDQQEPAHRPESTDFSMIDGMGHFHAKDAQFDVVIASHVLEHLVNPMPFVEQCRRVCKPGGIVWFETPSEHSLLTPSYDVLHDDKFVSFWDDPTHVRPYTPMALYRIAIAFNMRPLGIQRAMYGDLPSVRMCAQKIDDSPMRYVTLVGCQDKTLAGVWQYIWQSPLAAPSELALSVHSKMQAECL